MTADIERLEDQLRTSFENGIDASERDIEERLQQFGTNKPPPIKPKGFCKIFCEMFNDFVLKLLLGAAIVSIVANTIIEADHRDIGRCQPPNGSLD